MTIHSYEGESVRIPSGVGMWAKPIEVMWSRERRVIWQHTPDRPDWKDYQMTTKMSIDPSYNMVIERISTRDAGRYSAKFQLKQGSPFYAMEVDLQVHRLPAPKIYSHRTSPSSRRLVMEPEDTAVELRCQASGAREGTILGWTKEGKPQQETEATAEGPKTELISTIEARQNDDGALFSCFTTHNDTDKVKTTTIKIKAKAGTKTDGTAAPLPKGNKGGMDPSTPQGPEWTIDNLVSFSMAATAMTASMIGITIWTINKCKGATYHLTAITN